MPEALITFVRGDKVGPETDYRDALPVNMYAVNRPMFGAQGYMLQSSGLTHHADVVGIDRGGVWNDRFDKHYRVSGERFIEVAADGSATVLGTVPGNGIASLPLSFNTQAVIADGRFFLYDPANGFREVTDPELGSPIDGVWVDGLYFFTDGEFIYHTDPGDEEAIDPLKFATAEFIPDFTYGVAKSEDNKILVFGRYSTEYFVNQATANFQFQRVPSRALKVGIVGTHCKTEVAGTTYILGGRKEEGISVHALGVGSAQAVSTREVDKVLNAYTEADLRDVVMESFEDNGTTMVVVHLPNETLVFNQTIAQSAGLESAWSIYKTDVYGDAPWRARFGVFDNNIGGWVFGDRRTNVLGLLDDTVATQYGDIVEWLLFTPFLYLKQQSIDKLDIETIPGYTGSDDATVFLSLTYNGVTWGREWTELYGGPTDYNKRFEVRRLGYVEDWVGIKLRGATTSRMAFNRGYITYG